MKKVLLLLAAVALVAGVFGLNGLRRDESGKSLLHVAAVEALPVEVTTPLCQPIERTVQAPGGIEAVLEVEIRSEIPAKIEEMPVEEGDAVKAGQLLCRLNDDAYQAEVDSGEAVIARLQAMIRQAEADLTKCQLDCTRREEFARSGAASDYELADYRIKLIKAQADVEARKQSLAEAEARLRRARENLKKTVITSPIGGIVSKIYAKSGEVVVTGTMNNPGTNIMVITDLSQMQVRARVDETDVPSIKPDQPADIFLPSDPRRPIPGRVWRIATSGTKAAGRDVVTFETLVLVESDNPAIKPGMTCNVEIRVARKEEALTVPIQAVVHRKRKDLPTELVEKFDRRQSELGIKERQNKAQYLMVVFCMDEDKARPRLVRTGIADEVRVELVEGIEPDSTVIIGPYRSLDQLKDDTLVKLQEPTDAEKKPDEQTKLAGNQAGDEQKQDDNSEDGGTVAQAQ